MSSVSGQLSDEQYLEHTEFPIFLRHLFMQAAVVRVSPEDCIDFAEKYFRRMQSCRNVLGADFLFITSCRQNRRAFVFCLLELFRSIPADHELTVAEFRQVVEMICPDFPRSMVEDAANCLVPVALILPPPPISSQSIPALTAVSSAAQQQPQSQPQQQQQLQQLQPLRKYTLDDLRVSLCLHLVYEVWLKRLRWHDDSTNIFRVRASIEEMQTRDAATFSVSRSSSSSSSIAAIGGDDKVSALTYFEQPPASAIEAVLTSLGTQVGPDCTFLALKRALVASEAVRADVLKVSRHATPLSSVASVGPGPAEQAQAQAQADTTLVSLDPSATTSGPPGTGSSNADAATVVKTASQAKAASSDDDDDDN